jgi:hypothetical protein
MTCHAIYWQKARTKSKDIGGSDRLTGGGVYQRVNMRSSVFEHNFLGKDKGHSITGHEGPRWGVEV